MQPITTATIARDVPSVASAQERFIPAYVTNARLRAWVQELAALCTPDHVHWCDGSQPEYDALIPFLHQWGRGVDDEQR